MRLLSRKLGDPIRLGIEGDRLCEPREVLVQDELLLELIEERLLLLDDRLPEDDELLLLLRLLEDLTEKITF